LGRGIGTADVINRGKLMAVLRVCNVLLNGPPDLPQVTKAFYTFGFLDT
jgi:hypothetical protein